MWNSTMQRAFNDLPTTKNSVSMFPSTGTVRDNQQVDYIYPVMAMEVYPGETIELKMSGLKRIIGLKHLPYDGLKTKFHFFFVPNRLVWENWDVFMGAIDLAKQYDFDPYSLTVPKVRGKPELYSIYDYIGEPIRTADGGQVKEDIEMNALPYRGLNMIYNTFFRRENIQSYKVVHRGNDGEDEMEDYHLFKVNKDLDLFTSCLPWAQKGDPVEINLGGLAPIITPENEKIKVKGFLNDDDTIDVLKDNPLKIATFSRYNGNLEKRIVGLGMELVPTNSNSLNWVSSGSVGSLRYYENALARTTIQLGIGEITKDINDVRNINVLNVPIETRGSQEDIRNLTRPNVSQSPTVVGFNNDALEGHFGSTFTWNNINTSGFGADGHTAALCVNNKEGDGKVLYLQNNEDYRYGTEEMATRITSETTGDNRKRVPQTTPAQFTSDSHIGQLDMKDAAKLKADLSQASYSMTVNDLRLDILKQQFNELMARAGAGRYNELVYAIWGVDMGFVRAEIPEYLGGFSLNWNFIPVVQTAPGVEGATQLGTLASNGELKFANKLCFRRSFTEYGFVIGVTYTKGDLSYSQGTPLKNSRTRMEDYFLPMFQDAGEQEILLERLYCTGEEENDKTAFGFMPYGSAEKFVQSRDSADFRPLSDGNGGLKQNLAMWHFGEYFEDAPKLGEKFLESNTPVERIVSQYENPRIIEGIIALQMKAFKQMKTVATPGVDKV